MNKKNSNNITDLEDLENILLKQYSELNLRKLDKYDISEYFGISIDDDTLSLFLTDYIDDEDKPSPFDPKKLIVIYYGSNIESYNILRDYIDGIIQNTEDQEKINLYKEAVLEKTNRYYYLIMGMDNNVKKIINDYLNK